MKKLDKLENEFLPHVMVDTTEVVFDNIHFLESQSKDLTIANTGQVSEGGIHSFLSTLVCVCVCVCVCVLIYTNFS